MNADDPKFTAHVLGEFEDLTRAERAEIDALLASDPAAAADAAETRALAARLRAELAGEAADALADEQRAAVLKAAEWAAAQVHAVRFRKRVHAFGTIAACLVAGVSAALVIYKMQDGPAPRSAITTTPLAASADFPVIGIRNEPKVASFAAAAPLMPPPAVLPVQNGGVALAKDGYGNVLLNPATAAPPVPSPATLGGGNSNPRATVVQSGGVVFSSSTFSSSLNGNDATGMVVRSVTITRNGNGTLSATSLVTGSLAGMQAAPLSGANPDQRVPVINVAQPAQIGSLSAPVNLLADGHFPIQGGPGIVVARPAAPAEPSPAIATSDGIAGRGFVTVPEYPLSRFRVDVNPATYAVVRRFIDGGQRPPADAVRIGDLLNSFSYENPPPSGDQPFAARLEAAACPWAPEHRLVRIGLKGREIPEGQHPPDKLPTVAREVNIQVEFNPAQVDAYWLVGDEKRAPAAEVLTDHREGASEVAAGYAVTALYEVAPAGAAASHVPAGDALLTLKVYYKVPGEDTGKSLEFPLVDSGASWEKSSPDFRFAAAVAGFGMLLGDSQYRGQATWASVAEWAREGLGRDAGGERAVFLGLVEKARSLAR